MLVLVIVLGTTAAALAGTASAAYRHPSKAEQFGTAGTEGEPGFQFSGINQLTVDQARNRLYVSTETGKVFGFSVPTATTHTPLAGYPLTAEGSYGGGAIAADSGTGNLYTIKGNYPSILYGFDSSGSPLTGFPIRFSLPQCGLAVDGGGRIAESDPEGAREIRLFNSNGISVGTIDASTIGRPCQLVFDQTTNDLYVATNEGGIFRLAAGDGYSTPTRVASGSVRGMAFDASRGVLYLLFGSHVVAYDRAGEELETFAEPESPGYEFTGVTVDEATGVVYVGGGGYPYQVSTYPGAVLPDVTTGEPVGNEVVSGHVDPVGGGPITGCQVEYGETTAYGEAVACSPLTPYAAAQNVTATLTGLNLETTYHYRVTAGNAKGTSYGADETITPHRVEALRTNPADELTRTCATLHGSFTGNGEETHYYFEYGETETYGGKSATPPGTSAGSGTGAQAESYRLCGLTPGTTYHFRIVASNPQGTSLGNDRTLKTVSAVESLATEPGTVLNATEAVMHASFTGNGEDTHYYFEYGYNTLYGSQSATPPGVDAGAPSGHVALSSPLTGLYPGTTYHYRIVASNAVGTTYGEDVSFTTPRLPEIATAAPSDAHELPDGSRGVTLNGSVNPLNGGATTYHFEYGPTTGYGTSTPEAGPVGADPDPHPVSAVVDGLAPGTIYHYRLVAHSSAGTSYGPDQTYQAIPDPPSVVSSAAADVGVTTATINAVVRTGNGSTAVVVDFGTTTEYGQTTQAGTPIGADQSDHAVSRAISGLQPNTTYHFRVAAINFRGVAYGPDQTFSTAGVPIILGEGAKEVGQNAATFMATVSPNLLATSYRFEYGPEGRYGSTTATAPLGADGSGHLVSARVGGLAPGTKYRVRVVATNVLGTTAGGGAAFTTTTAAPAHTPLVCKKGTVKRKGKCVKKKTHRKQKSKKHGKHDGGSNR